MLISYAEFKAASSDDAALVALSTKLRNLYEELGGPLAPTLPNEEVAYVLDTLESKVSVSGIRLARLFQYFLFVRKDGTMPSLLDRDADLKDGIRRYQKLHDFTRSILSTHISVPELDVRYHAELSSEFPNLELVRLAFLCRWAFRYHRSVEIESSLRQSNTPVPLGRVAMAPLARHGRGYAIYESGSLERLRRYCQDTDSLQAEYVHAAILDELSKRVTRLECAREVHPMVFITELSKLVKYVNEQLAQEIAPSKHFWQVSTGPDRVALSGRIDAMLHIFCLRTLWPKGRGKTFKDIVEATGWDGYSENPEKTASKVITTEIPNEPWWGAYAPLRDGDHTAYWFREFADLEFEEYMTTAGSIEAGRREIDQ